jgi:hypothetical protein
MPLADLFAAIGLTLESSEWDKLRMRGDGQFVPRGTAPLVVPAHVESRATIPKLQSKTPSQKWSLPSTDLTALTSASWETIKPTACSHRWQTENTDWWRSPH